MYLSHHRMFRIYSPSLSTTRRCNWSWRRRATVRWSRRSFTFGTLFFLLYIARFFFFFFFFEFHQFRNSILKRISDSQVQVNLARKISFWNSILSDLAFSSSYLIWGFCKLWCLAVKFIPLVSWVLGFSDFREFQFKKNWIRSQMVGSYIIVCYFTF